MQLTHNHMAAFVLRTRRATPARTVRPATAECAHTRACVRMCVCVCVFWVIVWYMRCFDDVQNNKPPREKGTQTNNTRVRKENSLINK